MSRIGRLAVTSALVAGCVAAAVAQQDPLAILRASIRARSTVSYSGLRTVVIFENGVKLAGVQQQIQCQAPGNIRVVVIAPESEAGKLCVSDGRHYWEWYPDSRRAVKTELPPPEVITRRRLEELERMADEMKLQYVGTEDVAGRVTHVVKVYTRNGVPLKKAWVDSGKWLTLKTQRFDSHGRVKSSAYFTRINYDPHFEPGIFEFTPPEDATIVHAPTSGESMPLDEAERRVGFEAVLPEYLPAGYHLQRDQVHVLKINGNISLWLSFTNGADTFSLFQRRVRGAADDVVREHSITWDEGGFRFTLMGALSSVEMERVRQSIAP